MTQTKNKNRQIVKKCARIFNLKKKNERKKREHEIIHQRERKEIKANKIRSEQKTKTNLFGLPKINTVYAQFNSL